MIHFKFFEKKNISPVAPSRLERLQPGPHWSCPDSPYSWLWRCPPAYRWLQPDPPCQQIIYVAAVVFFFNYNRKNPYYMLHMFTIALKRMELTLTKPTSCQRWYPRWHLSELEHSQTSYLGWERKKRENNKVKTFWHKADKLCTCIFLKNSITSVHGSQMKHMSVLDCCKARLASDTRLQLSSPVHSDPLN